MRRLPFRSRTPANVFFSLTRFIFIVFRLRLPLPRPPRLLSHFQSLSSNNRTLQALGSRQSGFWRRATGVWSLKPGVWNLQLPVASRRERRRQNAFNFYGSNGVLCTNPVASPAGCVRRTLTRFSSHRNCTLTRQWQDFPQPPLPLPLPLPAPICMRYLLNAASSPQFDAGQRRSGQPDDPTTVHCAPARDLST